MDLNGLISTITTSTAALVAIIGGFLVSRVISLSSEQNGIKRRIREINNDLVANREMKDNAEKFLFEDDLNDFFTEENIKRMIEGKSLETIIEEDDYYYLTQEELEPYFKQMKEIVNEIFELNNSTDKYYEKFNEFMKDFTDFKYPDRMNWYEKVFDAINAIVEESQGPFAHIKFKPLVNPNYDPHMEYKDTKKERERLKSVIRSLELQKEEQMKILNDYGKPKWVWTGLFVLIYACIVGIIYPSTLLPYPKDIYDDVLTKWFLLGLFFSQLIALFVYLGFAMYKLTNDKDES